MRSLIELVESDDPAWPEVEAAVAAAPYPVEVLVADARQADAELLRLQVTSRSWLGAVVHRCGGLVIDHGWLRVLGSGNKQRRLASLGEINEGIGGGIVVAQDVLGGQFAWVAPAEATPTIGTSPRTPCAGRTVRSATASGWRRCWAEASPASTRSCAGPDGPTRLRPAGSTKLSTLGHHCGPVKARISARCPAGRYRCPRCWHRSATGNRAGRQLRPSSLIRNQSSDERTHLSPTERYRL